jgi:hypothetical protein
MTARKLNQPGDVIKARAILGKGRWLVVAAVPAPATMAAGTTAIVLRRWRKGKIDWSVPAKVLSQDGAASYIQPVKSLA